MFKALSRTVLAVTIIAASGSAFADGHGGNPAVKARVSLMNLYGHYMGTLGAMAKGSVEYDAEKAAGAANSLNLLASQLDQSAMWPQGTSNAELGDETRALSAIWSTYPAIMDKAQGMTAAAATMAEVAGVDLPSMQGAMKALGASCGACHKDFRQPKN